MSYIDGFVIPVPAAHKEKFIAHASYTDTLFKELGAIRVIECWGDDVPAGEVTDFRRAVNAKDDEIVVFSWVEWPDKETRDAAEVRMHEMMDSDERFDENKNPVPFDGKRMIYGGFQSIVEL